jgi:Sigma-70 region 3
MTPEKVIEVQKYGREPISLDTPLGEDGDSEFRDLIEDSEDRAGGRRVVHARAEQLHSVLDTLRAGDQGGVDAVSGVPTVSRKRWTRSTRSTAVPGSGSARSSRCRSYGTRRAPRCCATPSTDSILVLQRHFVDDRAAPAGMQGSS